jgi:hypothetical protein
MNSIMKRILNITGIALMFLFLAAACNQQGQRTDLDSVRDEFRDALAQIEDALRIQEFDDFKSRAEDAISSVDSAVDDYLNEMDNNDRRIDQQTRNQVINIKQKRAEVDFKLSLLDHDRSGDGWETNRNRTGTRTTTDGRTDGATQRGATTDDAGIYDQRTATDRTTADTRTGTTRDDAVVTGRTRTDDRGWTTDDDADESLYGRNLQEEIRNDLRELRDEVQQFMQANLDYQGELE